MLLKFSFDIPAQTARVPTPVLKMRWGVMATCHRSQKAIPFVMCTGFALPLEQAQSYVKLM